MAPVPGNGLRTPMLVSGTAAVRYARDPGPARCRRHRPTRSRGRRDRPQAAAQRLLQRPGRRGGRGAYRRRGGRLRGLAARQHRRRAGRLRRAHDRPAGRRHPPARAPPGRRDDRRGRTAARARRRTTRRRAPPGTCSAHCGTDSHDHRLSRPLHDRAGGAHRPGGRPSRPRSGPASALRRTPEISDDEIRESVEGNQLRLMTARGVDLHALLPARLGDGPPRRRRVGQSRVDPGLQRPDRPRGPALSRPLRRGVPASAVARRADRPRGGRAPAVRRGARVRGLQPQPGPERRPLDRRRH